MQCWRTQVSHTECNQCCTDCNSALSVMKMQKIRAAASTPECNGPKRYQLRTEPAEIWNLFATYACHAISQIDVAARANRTLIYYSVGCSAKKRIMQCSNVILLLLTSHKISQECVNTSDPLNKIELYKKWHQRLTMKAQCQQVSQQTRQNLAGAGSTDSFWLPSCLIKLSSEGYTSGVPASLGGTSCQNLPKLFFQSDSMDLARVESVYSTCASSNSRSCVSPALVWTLCIETISELTCRGRKQACVYVPFDVGSKQIDLMQQCLGATVHSLQVCRDGQASALCMMPATT